MTPDNTTKRMSDALSTVANGGPVKAAAEAHGVSVQALYAAMRRHKIREDERCPTCKRLIPTRNEHAFGHTPQEGSRE